MRVCARRLSGGRGAEAEAEAVATWAKANVIGSQFLNPDPACGPCLTSPSEGCRIAACQCCRAVSPHNASLQHVSLSIVE